MQVLFYANYFTRKGLYSLIKYFLCTITYLNIILLDTLVKQHVLEKGS